MYVLQEREMYFADGWPSVFRIGAAHSSLKEGYRHALLRGPSAASQWFAVILPDRIQIWAGRQVTLN